MEGQQPGQTISPHSQQEHEKVEHQVTHEQTVPDTAIDVNRSAASAQLAATQGEHHSHTTDDGGITWSAAEFAEHAKGFSWYLSLTFITVIVAGLIYVLTKDKISTGVIIVAAVFLGIMGARKPRTLEYHLSDDGIDVGGKFYPFEQFKSFSVIDEGAIPSIYLMPMRRFMPALSIYYSSKDEDAIVDVLADRLPIEDRQADPVDRFMHRIRF